LPDTPIFRPRSAAARLSAQQDGDGPFANRGIAHPWANERAYLERFGLDAEEIDAVMRRDWREMVRLGGNVFYILKISAIDPARMTEIRRASAGMDHETFLRGATRKSVRQDRRLTWHN